MGLIKTPFTHRFEKASERLEVRLTFSARTSLESIARRRGVTMTHLVDYMIKQLEKENASCE